MSTPTAPNVARLRVIAPILNALRNCAAAQLALIGRPPCDFVLNYAAHLPPADECDCECADGGQGAAWVRWVQSSGVAGAQQRPLPSDCAGGQLAITVEVGVYRCAPTIDPNTRPTAIGSSGWDDWGVGMLDDAEALQRAFVCCDWLSRKGLQWRITSVQPQGPAGGCAGVYVRAEITTGMCGCPEGARP